jgi:hypothetical protein
MSMDAALQIFLLGNQELRKKSKIRSFPDFIFPRLLHKLY